MSENPNQNQNTPYQPEESTDYSIAGGFEGPDGLQYEYGPDQLAQDLDEDFKKAFGGHTRQSVLRQQGLEQTRQQLAEAGPDLDLARSLVSQNVPLEPNRFDVVAKDKGDKPEGSADDAESQQSNALRWTSSSEDNPAQRTITINGKEYTVEEASEVAASHISTPLRAQSQRPLTDPASFNISGMPGEVFSPQAPEATSHSSAEQVGTTDEAPESAPDATEDEKLRNIKRLIAATQEREAQEKPVEPSQIREEQPRQEHVEPQIDAEREPKPEPVREPQKESEVQQASDEKTEDEKLTAIRANLANLKEQSAALQRESDASLAVTPETSAPAPTPEPEQPELVQPEPENPELSESDRLSTIRQLREQLVAKQQAEKSRTRHILAQGEDASTLPSEVVALTHTAESQVGNIHAFSGAATKRKGTNSKGGPNESRNQDLFYADPDALAAAVADGVGGSEDGAAAAHAAIRVAEDKWFNVHDEMTSDIATGTLRHVAEDARKEVAETGSSTTFVGGQIFEENGQMKLAVLNAGDSKAIAIDASTGEIVFQTREQSGYFYGEGGVILGGEPEADSLDYNEVREPNRIHNGFGASRTAENGDKWPRMADQVEVVDLPSNAIVVYMSDGVLGDKPEERVAIDDIRRYIMSNQSIPSAELAAGIVEMGKKNDDATVVVQRAELSAVSPDDAQQPGTTGSGENDDWTSLFSDWDNWNTPDPDTDWLQPAPDDQVPSAYAPAASVGDNSYPPLSSPNTHPLPYNAPPMPSYSPDMTPAPSTPETHTAGPQGFMDLYGGASRPESRTRRRAGILTRAQELASRFSRSEDTNQPDTSGAGAPATPAEPSFITRTRERLSGFFSARGEADPDTRANIATRRRNTAILAGIGVAATSAIAGAMYLGMSTDNNEDQRAGGDRPTASAPSWNGPSFDRPETASPTPEATKDTPSPEASQAKPSPTQSSPEAGASASPENDKEADKSPVPEQERPPKGDNAERDNGSPDANQEKDQTSYEEDGYKVIKNAENSYTIVLSQRGTSVWNGTKKALEKEGVAASDALVYDLTGQALRDAGTTWEEAGSIHQGSSVTVVNGPDGPRVTEVKLR